MLRARATAAAAPAARVPGRLMARLKVTQVKSGIGGKQNQRDTLRSLGLKRISDTVVKEDRPEIRGMVNTVTHLVTVEEVE
jgi:large subunit ribosomal protein L30